MIDKEISGIDLNQYLDKLREMGLFIQDIENQKAYPNSFWKKLGYSAEDMTNLGFLEFVHPDDKKMVEAAYGKVATAIHGSNELKFRIKSRSGKWHWVLSSSIGVKKSENGETFKYIGFDHDVTTEIEARVKAETALHEAESLIRATEIISSNLDLKSTINAILEQAKTVFSCTSASIQLIEGKVLKIVGDVGLLNDDSGEEIVFPITSWTPNSRVLTKRKPYIINSNLRKLYPNFLDKSIEGVKSWMGIPLLYQDKLIGMIAFDHSGEEHFADADLRLAQALASQIAIALENARLFEEVKALSIKDELTGCFSRRHFFECLGKESEMAKRYDSPLSCILFDVDDFKIVNDRFGHIEGDRILRDIATIAAEELRTVDVFSRYGGEEFVVLMPSTSIDEAFIVAERVRMSIEEKVSLPGRDLSVTVSLGCSVFIADENDGSERLLSRADRAMYDSKAAGKNRTTVMKSDK